MAAQRDASRRVAEARKFSVRLPVVGTVAVPPPDQLAFYAVLGGLAVVELIDWPVAVAMGVGSAVVTRHLTELEKREASAQPEASAQAVAPAPPAKKAAASRAPAKKTPARKVPARKAAARKQTSK